MFPSTAPTQQLSKTERELCRLYKSLGDNERETLLSFAEFLSHREVETKNKKKKRAVLQQPTLIIATEGESVVKGIKRLKLSYFMIENENLLHEVSALMSEHVMKGVSAQAVISKIEAVFDTFYQQYKKEFIEKHQGTE
jgi:uncharacterized protein YjcR